MNSLSKTPAASADAFRTFAAEPSNKGKIVVDVQQGAVRGEVLSKRMLEGLASERSGKMEITFPSSEKSSIDIEKDFSAALKEKYGKEVTQWAFPFRVKAYAAEHGLNTEMINTAFADLDFEETAQCAEQAADAARVAVTAKGVSESKVFAMQADSFAAQAKQAGDRYLEFFEKIESDSPAHAFKNADQVKKFVRSAADSAKQANDSVATKSSNISKNELIPEYDGAIETGIIDDSSKMLSGAVTRSQILNKWWALKQNVQTEEKNRTASDYILWRGAIEQLPQLRNELAALEKANPFLTEGLPETNEV